MTQKQTKNCLKVKSALIDIFHNGRLTRYLPTSYLAYELARTYNCIINNETVETINKELKDFYEKNGFTITNKGIGWIISL